MRYAAYLDAVKGVGTVAPYATQLACKVGKEALATAVLRQSTRSATSFVSRDAVQTTLGL